MHRRDFVMQSGAALALALSGTGTIRGARRAPRVLLRSSWQVVNIGDIAHTPGVLALIGAHIPDAEVRLWASPDLSEEVAAMEHRRFPGLRIVKGVIGSDGTASTPELSESVEWCDFLLHGSGPSFVAYKDVSAFAARTGKPFGVYGITFGGAGEAECNLLTRARFVFFRDSVSLERARASGVRCPVMQFAPDGAFACDLRNDAASTAFLRANGLAEGRFLCCIPRFRYTPYWKVRGTAMTPEDDRKHARNEEMKEHDHAPIRAAIAAAVRDAGLKVLICPEDVTQMAVGREMLLEKLPADVRRGVVWREKFWLTDEALSTYVRSAGLFGLEMHSPIMSVGNGVPAIVCRFAEQTSKGFMWRDIGLGEWLFDLDREEDVARIVPAVLDLVRDAGRARRRVSEAIGIVRRRQAETMALLADNLR
jgi:polysaccharide pyruvyl transferase WcaK-like protein